jgi:hypothetical protein
VKVGLLHLQVYLLKNGKERYAHSEAIQVYQKTNIFDIIFIAPDFPFKKRRLKSWSGARLAKMRAFLYMQTPIYVSEKSLFS